MASGSSVPAGGCTIVVTITSSTPGTVTNTTGTLDTNAGSRAARDVRRSPSLRRPRSAKTINPASIAIGGTATLTLTLGNTNPPPITLSAPLTDTMPAGVTTTSGNTGTCAGVTVASTSITHGRAAPRIPAGGCTIVVTITSSTPGTVTNTTSTLSTSAGAAPPASAPLTVTAVAPTLAKTIVPPTDRGRRHRDAHADARQRQRDRRSRCRRHSPTTCRRA